MIIVNLKGGLGNQMFQYALGRHLALKNQTELKLDIGGLARANAVGDIYRDFGLKDFAISATPATPAEIKRLKYPYGFFSKGLRYICFKLSRDKNTLFRASALDAKAPLYLDGYWQSPRYFEAIRDTLLSEYTLQVPLTGDAIIFKEQIATSTAVALHVRRGDYAKNPRVMHDFGLCSVQYFETAIRTIKDKVANPTFFVFSDDIEWVQNNLIIGDSVVYVAGEGLKDTVELSLMSQCNHIITSNSTFSWWAAWLNNHPDKIVITPTPWFDHQPYDSSLISPTWIQLPK